MTRSIKKLSDEADANADWNMFRDSSNGIEEYTTLVTGFIKKCIDDVVPAVTERAYSNQKTWITGKIRNELKGRAAASRSGTPTRKLIRNPTMPSDEPSNRQSINTGLRLNPSTPASDAHRMWRGLQTITDCKGKHSRELPSDTSLPDKLNYFYARFEASNTETCMRAPTVRDDCVITLSAVDVSKTFKQVNIHKAAWPD